jgi:hypothetical protein
MQSSSVSQSPSFAPHWLELVQQSKPPVPSEQLVTVIKVIVLKLHIEPFLGNKILMFGLVLNQLALLKISDWAVKHATFASYF